MLFFIKILFFKAVRLVLLIAAVATLSFILVSNSPIDPVDAYIGPAILKISPEQREIIARRWGFNKPPVERFLTWAGRLATGDFGVSTIFNQPVLTVIGNRFVTSFWLMVLAWTFSGIFGFFLGLVAGARDEGLLDRGIRLYAYTMASTPTFWVGIVLLMVFSVFLGWTPTCCAWPLGMSADQATIWQRLHHLLLPAITLSLVGVAKITLHTREKTIKAMHSDYAIFARAQGETTLGIILRHAVRNVALPAVTL